MSSRSKGFRYDARKSFLCVEDDDMGDWLSE
jgi:hypothetical protein